MSAVTAKWLRQRQPPTGPIGAPTDAAASGCVSAQMTILNAGADGAAALDLTPLGLVTGRTYYADLKIVSIQDVDGEIPVTQHHPCVFWIDAGAVQVAAAPPAALETTVSDPEAATLIGGTANYAAGNTPAVIVVSSSGPLELTVEYTPTAPALMVAGAVELCVGPHITTIPAGQTGPAE